MRAIFVLFMLSFATVGSIYVSPQTLLEHEVEDFAQALGVDVDADLAHVDSGAAIALRSVLQELRTCHDLSQSLVAEISQIGLERAFELTHWDGVMRACMEDVTPALQAAASASQNSAAIDVWPVILVETDGQDNIYHHDYVLLIDLGGNDEYYNNAGGNVLDVTNGPETPAASGCETVAQALAAECVIAASAFLDAEGNDVYGEMEKPNHDRRCTSQKLVRRIVIQGGAVAGVGVLVDKLGDDTYTAKTVAQGAGHVFGAGYHREEKGDDTYLAIRQSQGAGLVGGFGFLDDLGGNDQYDHYMPRGGVVDDTDVCDDVPRYTLGAGTLGGIGFFNGEGSPSTDHYIGSAMSMGFADNGGTGFFHDRLGEDTYEGAPGRGNDRTLTNTFLDTGVNLFMDHATG